MASLRKTRERPGRQLPGGSRFWTALGPKPGLQCIVALGVALVIYLLAHTLVSNMAQSGIVAGFGFLGQPANFEIGESLIPYTSQSSFGRAILVGLLNTLTVSAAGCVLATVLGVTLGIARISGNNLIAMAVRVYVEVIRNTPLLLQLFFWSAAVKSLPVVKKALEPVPGVLLSNRGLYFPALSLDHPTPLLLAVACLAVGWWWVRRRLANRPDLRLRGAVALLVAVLFILTFVLVLGGVRVELPERVGFNIKGGLSQTPEFAALLLGLAINAAAGISEIVRSGIESVSKGQWEAATALGLRQGQIMRLVVLPQALRVIVPLMTSSYLSLAKNSSLAVAIGYPDVVSILNTTANQTGQALEAIVIMLGIYLGLSLAVSLIMNRLDARFALKER
jgi:general L-amino acid transport system permease protein